MDGLICPFMSGPVVLQGWASAEVDIPCRREQCAAWHQFHDPNDRDYCLLIGRHQ